MNLQEIFGLMIGATVTLVIVYFFFYDGDNSSKVIRAGSQGWADVIRAFQGQRQIGGL